MKKWLLSLILILNMTHLFAREEPETPVFPVDKYTQLSENPKTNGKVYGSLEALTDKEKAKKMRLIGQVQIEPLKGQLRGETKIVIGWIGVQKIDDLSQVVAFKEPIVSSFTIPTGTSLKGLPLPLAGEVVSLDEAISDLENNRLNPDDLKRKRVVKVPHSKKRSVLLQKRKPAKEESFGDGFDKGEEASAAVDGESFSATDSHHPNEGSSRSRNPSYAGSSGSNTSFNLGSNAGMNNPSHFMKPKELSNAVQSESLGKIKIEDGTKKENKPVGVSAPSPTIRIDVTEVGCPPRIDRIHERVIIQNRARKFQDETVVDEGECSDSTEFYDIKRDYLCDSCEDRVNPEQRLAHPRYQEYWINRDGEKHYLSEVVYVDESEPYAFFDERRFCHPFIDFEKSQVFNQVQTGYLNKFNAFKRVQDCHPIEPFVPLIETSQGCELLHDFPQSISYLQNRLVYSLEGVEREARGCEQVEPGFKHQFTETGCHRALDWQNKRITPLFRRKISVNGRDKIITDECEPLGNHPLQATRQGCEGQYFNDFTAGRGYIMKRYYYDNNGREYVSGCIRTDEFLEHKMEHHGEWVHDDKTRVSRPKLSIYIDSLEQGKLVLDGAKVRGDIQKFDYELLRNEHRATKEVYFEGCFRRTKTNSFNVYQRGDKTLYELLMGYGDPIKSTVDECKRTYESQYVNQGWYLHYINGPSTYYKYFRRRNVTTYPGGKVEYGQWHDVSEQAEPPQESNYSYGNESSSNPSHGDR